MLKLIVVGIAGVALGASTVGYINYTNNQSIEDKYVYLKRDVQQLTKKITELNEKIEKRATNSFNQQDITVTNRTKKNRMTANNYNHSLSSTEHNAVRLDKIKLVIQDKARKKHLGKSQATN
ncbi:hypothetical protein A3Q34_06735 [Colwellia sp. PAMC 20917]|uniref:hypothetical protein n=1 Tax=Colwellia sp. PAMC 20917 TaxID=1816218 RepID=UPI000878938D|nr:hypothetical protein [Colwellia sp. PAMC 20917]AOW76581.1 hypothetical protein A3Q34_06735 [Colwellia sp. PAMC 20917]